MAHFFLISNGKNNRESFAQKAKNIHLLTLCSILPRFKANINSLFLFTKKHI